MISLKNYLPRLSLFPPNFYRSSKKKIKSNNMVGAKNIDGEMIILRIEGQLAKKIIKN